MKTENSLNSQKMNIRKKLFEIFLKTTDWRLTLVLTARFRVRFTGLDLG